MFQYIIAVCSCGGHFDSYQLDGAIYHRNTDSVQSCHSWVYVDPTVAFLLSNDKVHQLPRRRIHDY